MSNLKGVPISWLKCPTSNSSAKNTSAQTHQLDHNVLKQLENVHDLSKYVCRYSCDYTSKTSMKSNLNSSLCNSRPRYFKTALELHLGFIMQPNYQVGQSNVPNKISVLHSPPNQNKFNNYISLRRDNDSPTCQVNNFVCLTTKYKPQVLRDNPENQAELWPLPQNKHLSKQMDLAFKIYK